MPFIEQLQTGTTVYDISDANTYKSLSATQRATLLSAGTYLGEAVDTGKIFETDSGKFEQFTKTVGPAEWTWTSGSIGYASWYTIAYGNGVFVAGGGGEPPVKYSTNGGQTWNSTSLSSSLIIQCVTYGNGKFVALTSTKALYSTNGSSWSEVELPANRDWRCITYGNDMFVAGSLYGYIAYSTDGATWTEVNVGISIKSVTYGNGKFVAISSSGGVYSTNGSTWTSFTMPSGNNWWALAYGDGKFVAIEQNTSNAAYSTNGTTWTKTSLPASRGWSAVVYGDEGFVAVAQQTDKAAYSTDGTTWTEITISGYSFWKGIAYGEGKYVAVAQNYQNTAIGSIAAPVTYSLLDLNADHLKNTATGVNSLTIGGTAATGSNAANVGKASAAGYASTSLGYSAQAGGTGCIAIGYSTRANQQGAVAVGATAQATAKGAIALGNCARNSETKTFKVALSDNNTPATDESTGLFTLLKADGKVPVERLGGSTASTDNTFLKKDGTWAAAGGQASYDAQTKTIQL